MLRQLGEMMRDVFLVDIAALAAPDQVSFQAPDGTFRADVPNHPPAMVDVYLVDLRENRRLRSNERIRQVVNGTVQLDVAPDRIDCHYLISAWTATQPAAGLDPALEEHALLYEVTESLSARAPLNPTRVYPAGDPRLGNWPIGFQDTDLPTALVPPEGFSKLSEFWATMGSDMRWKPVVYLVVTLPLAQVSQVAGPQVTTMMSDYRITGVATTSAIWTEIGGEVLRTVAPGVTAPVADAWVRIETLAGVTLQLVRSNADGRFRLGALRPGTFRIVARAAGFTPDQQRVVTIPSETGEYDLVFP
jgi:hypothetical protein